MISTKFVGLDLDDAALATITFDRREKRNALSPEMLVQLLHAIEGAVSSDRSVIVVKSNAPGVFCAGFDINFLETPEEESGEGLLHTCTEMLEITNKPTIAVADGVVVGGGLELFMSCDLRLSTPQSVFRMPPVQLARVYFTGGIARFMRKIGLTATTEMLLTGCELTAEEALRVGVVTRVVPDVSAAKSYCDRVGALPRVAQSATKAVLRELAKGLVNSHVDPHGEARALMDAAEHSEDAAEAAAAFLAKRKPIFTGR